jgi:hypothetical protein
MCYNASARGLFFHRRWKLVKAIMHSTWYHKYIIPLFFFIMAATAHVAFAAPPLNISPNNIPNGQVSTFYSATLTGSNGTTPYSWSITNGSLPSGLFFNPAPSPSLTAVISGTPVLSGNFSFDVTLTDSSAPTKKTNTQTYKVTIVPPCSFFDTNIGSISFNNINPSSTPGPALGIITQQINIVCKQNMAYTVTASPASGWTINSVLNALDTIPFTFGYNTGGTGGGSNAPIPLLTTSPAPQILQPNYVNAAVGAYQNNQAVTFTISWQQAGGGSIIASLPVGNVSATIMPLCVVSQSPGSMSFNIDPSASSVSTTLSPDLQIKCTNKGTVNVSATSTCGGSMMSSYPPSCSGSGIPYKFTCMGSITGCSGSILGTGFGGGGLSMGIGGSSTSADFANAPIGTYGDTQTIQINY